jgi:WD40 repeat protein
MEQSPSGEDDCINQCQIVRSFANSKCLVTGDRYGVLRIIDTITQDCTFETRAHVSDIQDIAIFETNETILVASCGRDRTIQLFRKLSDLWVLVQTLDEHSASVCGLFFAENGEKLISCSTDRTVHIRQLVKKDVGGEDMIGAGKQAPS